MKRLFFIFLYSTLTAGCFLVPEASGQVNLKEITDGFFRQETSVGEMRPMPEDGEHYTALNDGRNMIVKYAYRTGNAVDTLFDAATARECDFDRFDGYIISSTGHHIILWRNTEAIYRRSFRAEVYHYDV
ncbi:MAG: S9 family peptidase, partial [Tannerellaceae bacterium]|nr:S9 family peptidase [Tannerellaceae bacterium]